MCRENERTHKHHIVPRYMRGTDATENLVEVTITKHAMFHFCNYQLWGNVEDYVAWRALSGQLSKAEFMAEKQSIFGKIGNDRLQEKLKNNPQLKQELIQKQIDSWNKNKEKNMEKIRLSQPKAVEAARTPEARKNKKRKFKEIKHQQGERNSQYGTIWIHNLKLRKNKKIDKNSDIPEGWKPGRIENFDTYFKKQESKKLKELKRQEELKNKIKYYEEMYDYYLTKGFSYIRDVLGYNRTENNLIMQFKRYAGSYDKTKCCVENLLTPHHHPCYNDHRPAEGH